MLERLSVQQFLLLDDIDLAFQHGFNVLTGETGAGKSLLMDALDLCLGARSGADLVRSPHLFATLTAVFSHVSTSLKMWMFEQGLTQGASGEEALILKRVLSHQGKSRAFINDQPVTLGILRALGAQLVQIHGQFDPLLEPHRSLDLIDTYGSLADDVKSVRQCFEIWKETEKKEQEAQKHYDAHHTLIEERRALLQMLDVLAPQVDEEQRLLQQREALRLRMKALEGYQALRNLLETPTSCLGRLQEAKRMADKISAISPEISTLSGLIHESLTSLTEAEFLLSQGPEDDHLLMERLHHLDGRLSDLRACAKKMNCDADGLAALKEQWDKEQHDLSSESLEHYRREVAHAEHLYREQAECLSEKRIQVARNLTTEVGALCASLRLPQARFEVIVTHDAIPSVNGVDRIVFMLQTNPGFPSAPLDQVASGGERSRLMLAFRTVLSEKAGTPVMVFDEIDSGMSGSVAYVVGGHMASMGRARQVISITHSPQVAARADHHFKLVKSHELHTSLTYVHQLSWEERTEEIARMLAGPSITHETRLVAEQLLHR